MKNLTRSSFFLLLFTFACSKKFVSEDLNWIEGSSPEILKKIESHEWQENSKPIQIGKFQVLISQQSFMGIPIEGTYLKKVYKVSKSDSSLYSADARVFSPPSLKTVRGLSFDRNLILKALTLKSSNFEKIEIVEEKTVLKEFEGEFKAALKISFFDKSGVPWSIYADPNNKILELDREGSNFATKTDVSADIFPMGPKLSNLTTILLENLHLQPTLSNELAIVTSEADQKIVTLSNSLKFDPKDYRFDQVQSFYFLNRALAWMQKTFGINFSRQLEVAVHVGFPEKTNSAFYFQSKIRLGSGDDETYTKISQDPSIITHESFHFLVDQVAGLPYQGEGGSLNEAFSDFFTAIMLSNPKLAETSYLKGPFKRNLEINRKLSEKNGGLYFDSLIISSFFWEIAKQTGPEKSTQLAFAVLKSLHLHSDFSDFEKKFDMVLKKEGATFLTKEQIELIKHIAIDRGFYVS